MTASCREQIVAKVLAVLGTITGVTGLAVERERDTDVTEADVPRLVLFEAAEQDISFLTGEDRYVLTLDVEGVASGADGPTAQAAANDLAAKAIQAMRADVTLGGLAQDVRTAEEPGPQRLAVPAEDRYRGFVRSFDVEYATAYGDPFTFA